MFDTFVTHPWTVALTIIATFIGGWAAFDYFRVSYYKPWREARRNCRPKSAEDEMALELPEDQVPLGSPFYLARPPTESDAYEEIIKPGALIHIKAPRYMGKTSLMVRILNHANQQSHRTVTLSFRQAEAAVFSDLDQFLRWFCASVTEALGLPDKLADYWQGTSGSNNLCTKYFQTYLLTEIARPLTLGLDDVDKVFKHAGIVEDFLGMLRVWHDKGTNEEIWQKLRLVLVHSEEYVPRNINRSPFNVGFPIDLPDFNQAQVQDLLITTTPAKLARQTRQTTDGDDRRTSLLVARRPLSTGPPTHDFA